MPQAKEQDQNLKGALCYLLGFISGIYFLLTEPKNSFIRFHALQSTAVFLILFVLSFVPLLGFLITPLSLILWVFLMYKAYNGEKYKLPYVGDFAAKSAGK